jgi:hypothetical protein
MSEDLNQIYCGRSLGMNTKTSLFFATEPSILP